MPKVAVLATGLTAAILVAMMGPSTAQATPGQQSDCSACHSAVSGPVSAVPSVSSMAASTAYTVLVTPPLNTTGGGSTGFRIANPDDTTTGVNGGGPGTAATTITAAMTAPAVAGTYTYTVWAVNGPAYGTGMANSNTYTITVGTTTPPVTTTTTPPVTKPVAPTGATATAGNGQALVSWTPAGNGGSTITSYTVTASAGSETATATSGATSANVTELTNGTAYTFTVTATNNIGTSPASVASTSVTPSATPVATTTSTAPAVVAGVAEDASAIIPVGAPNTGAGGASRSTNGPLVGLGGVALLLASAGATQAVRRRRQV